MKKKTKKIALDFGPDVEQRLVSSLLFCNRYLAKIKAAKTDAKATVPFFDIRIREVILY